MTNVDRPRLMVSAVMAGLQGATGLMAVALFIGNSTSRAVWLSVAAAPLAALGWGVYLRRELRVPAQQGQPANRKDIDTALRALASGQTPREARVHELAGHLAKQRLGVPKDALVLMVFVPVMVVGCIWLALTNNAVGWWYAGVWVLSGPWLIAWSRRLEQRARRFQASLP